MEMENVNVIDVIIKNSDVTDVRDKESAERYIQLCEKKEFDPVFAVKHRKLSISKLQKSITKNFYDDDPIQWD